MYEDLVKLARHCAEVDACINCPVGGCQGVTGIMNRLADAIEELSKPRWISVTERLPEKSGDYLVFDDCRNLYVNEWHCLLKKWQYDDSRITHWMPLPEPPKEET